MSDEQARELRDAREAALRAAATAARWHDVATGAVAAYGTELLGFLVALTRDGQLADEVFGQLLEDVWSGLPQFRWECTLRTWMYQLARNALVRQRRRQPRAAVPLDERIATLAAEVRTQTASFLRTTNRDRFASVRETLAPEDQMLLILRINRGLSWREVAQILPGTDAALDAAGLTRRAATLRKHFERMKAELRQKLQRAKP